MGLKVGLKVCPASCPMYAGTGSSSHNFTNTTKAQQDLVKILNSPLFGKTVYVKMGPIVIGKRVPKVCCLFLTEPQRLIFFSNIWILLAARRSLKGIIMQ